MQSQELFIYKSRPENFKYFFRALFTISDSGQAWNFLGIGFLSVTCKFSILFFFFSEKKHSNWGKKILNPIVVFPNGFFQINWIILLLHKNWFSCLESQCSSMAWFQRFGCSLFHSQRYSMRILEQHRSQKEREHGY